MRLRLHRFLSTEEGTFGQMWVGDDLRLFTVERPWADNQPNVSCVPAGSYMLEPHRSRRFGETWALVGGSVSHHPNLYTLRDGILLHAANLSSELQGCIAPGLSLGFIHDEMAVLSSRSAMAKLRAALQVGAYGHGLDIIGSGNGEKGHG